MPDPTPAPAPTPPTPAADSVPATTVTTVGNDSDYVDDPVFGRQPKDVATQIKLQEQARIADAKASSGGDAATEAAQKAAQAVS